MMILFLLLFKSGVSYAALPIAQEYQVKAVFLYQFANFVRWPNLAFATSHASFNICILGKDPFREELDITIENEKVEGHLVQVQRLSDMVNIDICQILFISQSEEKYLIDILAYLQQRPVLTVSDIDNFVIQGGMIQFFKRGKRIRFSIDPKTVKEADLYISGNLLRIARIIRRPYR
ncbi:YfiR family protein [Candidatus Parabeggiatoa sp. HSG14]|uniref:YfiR family protein n=1 Tax=Candidatus Parabeggiatoa sp. HSG14 TaxID=3055593 RepID=UPI0025A816A5|nr:YfiR family protein [Thiotrichales bacterium HSG14]